MGADFYTKLLEQVGDKGLSTARARTRAMRVLVGNLGSSLRVFETPRFDSRLTTWE